MKIKTISNQDLHPTLQQFLDYVCQSPNLSKTVEDCARYLCIGPRQLRRICKQHLNLSPSEIMKTVLVNYAQQQLNQPYRSVKMIAYELGFSDSSNFSTYFKRTVGVSPKFYRKQVIQQEMSDLQMEMSE